MRIDKVVCLLVPRINDDFAWVMNMRSSMKVRRGWMAVVLPHGVLFRSGAEAKIRKKPSVFSVNAEELCIKDRAKNTGAGVV